jgi:hypothetical protein
MQPPPHIAANEVAPTVLSGGGKTTPELVLPEPLPVPDGSSVSFAPSGMPKPAEASKLTAHASPTRVLAARREKPQNVCEKRLKEAIGDTRG